VTIPQEIRVRAGLRPDTNVEFRYVRGQVILQKAEGAKGRGAAAVQKLRQAARRTSLSTDEILRRAGGE
jgi:bifunctional DNA-binding transcriptional regulator/antitoxin component of YhaV-PrlF toxin-antitoxin module